MPCVKNPLFNHGLLYNKGRNIKEHLFRHRTQISHYWWKISHYTYLHPIKYHPLIPLLSHDPILFGWFVVWICFFDFSIRCGMIIPIDTHIFFRWLETTKHLQYCYCFVYIYAYHTHIYIIYIIYYIPKLYLHYTIINTTIIPPFVLLKFPDMDDPVPRFCKQLEEWPRRLHRSRPRDQRFFGPLGIPIGTSATQQQRKWQHHEDIWGYIVRVWGYIDACIGLKFR